MIVVDICHSSKLYGEKGDWDLDLDIFLKGDWDEYCSFLRQRLEFSF